LTAAAVTGKAVAVNLQIAAATRKAAIAVLVLTIIAVVGMALRSRFLHTEAPGVLQLGDAVQVFYTAGSRVSAAPGYPNPHEIRVDGDVFIQQPASDIPLVIRTRLFVLTAHGPAAFRVTAHSDETGEQVEVLTGTVEARKAYPSPYLVPDTLASGEMSMVNETIDLMEKEKTDPGSLRAWRDALLASMPQNSSSGAESTTASGPHPSAPDTASHASRP
jgi:hypothetical protein